MNLNEIPDQHESYMALYADLWKEFYSPKDRDLWLKRNSLRRLGKLTREGLFGDKSSNYGRHPARFYTYMQDIAAQRAFREKEASRKLKGMFIFKIQTIEKEFGLKVRDYPELVGEDYGW